MAFLINDCTVLLSGILFEMFFFYIFNYNFPLPQIPSSSLPSQLHVLSPSKPKTLKSQNQTKQIKTTMQKQTNNPSPK